MYPKSFGTASDRRATILIAKVTQKRYSFLASLLTNQCNGLKSLEDLDSFLQDNINHFFSETNFDASAADDL